MSDTVREGLSEPIEAALLTDRRTLLSRGAAAIAALAGMRFVRPSGGDVDGLPQDAFRVLTAGGSLRLTARGLRLSGAAMPPRSGDRLSGQGELLSGTKKVGEFYSDCVCFHAPFGLNETAAAHVEYHIFNLTAGTIVGMGTVPPNGVNRPAAFAIIGGTGRFEGIKGSYQATQNPAQLGGDGSAEFAFHILR